MLIRKKEKHQSCGNGAFRVANTERVVYDHNALNTLISFG